MEVARSMAIISNIICNLKKRWILISRGQTSTMSWCNHKADLCGLVVTIRSGTGKQYVCSSKTSLDSSNTSQNSLLDATTYLCPIYLKSPMTSMPFGRMSCNQISSLVPNEKPHQPPVCDRWQMVPKNHLYESTTIHLYIHFEKISIPLSIFSAELFVHINLLWSLADRQAWRELSKYTSFLFYLKHSLCFAQPR